MPSVHNRDNDKIVPQRKTTR